MRKQLFLFSLLVPFLLMAGGWPKKKGSGYYKLGYSIVNGTHFYDKSGNKTSLSQNLGFYTTSFYAEYGLTDRLTVITYLPFATRAKLEAQTGSAGGSITTIGDTNLGFRYGLKVDQPTVISASLTFGLPLGQTSNNTSGGVGSLQTGDGEFNQLVKLESGHSLPNNFYASSYIGVNFRSNGFSEEFHVGGEFGHVGDQLIGILKFQIIRSMQNGANTETANADFFNNNMEILAVAPELAYKFSEKAGLSFNYTMYLLGRKTLASPNLTIGLFLDM